MNDSDMIERMAVISDKHGWKDDDVCSQEEAESRIAIIQKEDAQLWEQMRANTLAHALAESKNI
jgi:hypothetical protein